MKHARTCGGISQSVKVLFSPHREPPRTVAKIPQNPPRELRSAANSLMNPSVARPAAMGVRMSAPVRLLPPGTLGNRYCGASDRVQRQPLHPRCRPPQALTPTIESEHTSPWHKPNVPSRIPPARLMYPILLIKGAEKRTATAGPRIQAVGPPRSPARSNRRGGSLYVSRAWSMVVWDVRMNDRKGGVENKRPVRPPPCRCVALYLRRPAKRNAFRLHIKGNQDVTPAPLCSVEPGLADAAPNLLIARVVMARDRGATALERSCFEEADQTRGEPWPKSYCACVSSA